MHPWFQGIAVPRVLAHRGLVTPADAADGIVTDRSDIALKTLA